MRALGWILVIAGLAGCGGDEGGTPSAAPEASAPAASAVAASAPATQPAGDAPAGVSWRDAAFAPVKPVIEDTIAYGEATDRNLTGFLALPADVFEPPPGVLIIHEWWGLNDDTRALARRLAAEGFVVLAIDLYGDLVADTTTQAQAHMMRVMTEPEAALANISQGIEYLRRYALAPRVATFGWSFGGTWSLQAGLSFADQIDAVVTYYGQIVSDETELEKLTSPLMGMFAGADSSIPTEMVVGFRSALNNAGSNAVVRIYPDAEREFANPASENYRHEDAEDAWQRVIEFLNTELR